jgi:general secretion pathway protein N
MPSHSIPTSGKLVLAGLVTLCGLLGAASHLQPELLGIAARQSEKVKTIAAHVANVGVPSIAKSGEGGTKQASVDRGDALWAIPLASLTATRERPIFSPTRRPASAVVRLAPAQPPSAGQPLLVLLGAIAGETEGIAIFQDRTTKNTIRLKPGESHAGWTLQAVKAREAILQNEQKTAILVFPNPSAK